MSAADSGSGWHIDPWNTSAWNALLHGRKRWALYPPSVSGLPPGVADASPKDFFGRVLHALPAADRPLQCVLEKGETIFLPSGWWHGDGTRLFRTYRSVCSKAAAFSSCLILQHLLDHIFVQLSSICRPPSQLRRIVWMTPIARRFWRK